MTVSCIVCFAKLSPAMSAQLTPGEESNISFRSCVSYDDAGADEELVGAVEIVAVAAAEVEEDVAVSGFCR